MATVAIHGKRGVGTFTGLTFNVLSYTFNITCDMAESTVMSAAALAATAHWKAFLPGFKDWTATVECILPAAGIGLTAAGTEAALTIDETDTGGRIYTGNAICTGIGPASTSASIAACTLTFQGTDQLEENAT